MSVGVGVAGAAMARVGAVQPVPRRIDVSHADEAKPVLSLHGVVAGVQGLRFWGGNGVVGQPASKLASKVEGMDIFGLQIGKIRMCRQPGSTLTMVPEPASCLNPK